MLGIYVRPPPPWRINILYIDHSLICNTAYYIILSWQNGKHDKGESTYLFLIRIKLQYVTSQVWFGFLDPQKMGKVG